MACRRPSKTTATGAQPADPGRARWGRADRAGRARRACHTAAARRRPPGTAGLTRSLRVPAGTFRILMVLGVTVLAVTVLAVTLLSTDRLLVVLTPTRPHG